MSLIQTEVDLDLGELGLRTVQVTAEADSLITKEIAVEIKKILLEIPSSYSFEHHAYGPKQLVDIYPMIPQSKIEHLKQRLRSICLVERMRGREASGEVVNG